MTATKESINKAAVSIILAVYDLVKASENGVPEGELYAFLMPYGCNLQHLEMILGTLQESGLVNRKGHLVKAVK
jgi:hypothetical protein